MVIKIDDLDNEIIGAREVIRKMDEVAKNTKEFLGNSIKPRVIAWLNNLVEEQSVGLYKFRDFPSGRKIKIKYWPYCFYGYKNYPKENGVKWIIGSDRGFLTSNSIHVNLWSNYLPEVIVVHAVRWNFSKETTSISLEDVKKLFKDCFRTMPKKS